MRLEVSSNQYTAIKLWLTMMITLVCVMVGAKPVQAYDEYAFLRVNGNDMVRNGELVANVVKGETGTASFDEKTNTLTLDKFTTSTGVSTGISL